MLVYQGSPPAPKIFRWQVIPMMQPKAPQNSNESGSRTTLFLESKVSEDKRAHMGHVFLPQNNFSKVLVISRHIFI